MKEKDYNWQLSIGCYREFFTIFEFNSKYCKYNGYGYCYKKNPSFGNKCDPTGARDDCPSDKVCTLNSSEKGGVWECMDKIDPVLGAVRCDPFTIDPCSGGKICAGIGIIDSNGGQQYLCSNDPTMQGQDQPLRVNSEDQLLETLRSVDSGEIRGIEQIKGRVEQVSKGDNSYPLGLVPTNLLTIKNTVCKEDAQKGGVLCGAINNLLENEKLNPVKAVEEDELELWDQLCFIENGKVKNRVGSLDSLVGDLPLGVSALLGGVIGEDGILDWCKENDPDKPTSSNRRSLNSKSMANSIKGYIFENLYHLI